MAEESASTLDALQSSMLGAAVALLGMMAGGVAIRAFPDGDYLTGALAVLFAVVAALVILALLVDMVVRA